MMRTIISLIFLAILSACTSIGEHSQYQSIADQTWFKKDTLKFEVEIQDTIARYDLSHHVRHYTSYRYQNLWIEQEILGPNGFSHKDKLSLVLGDDRGYWLGAALNDIVQVKAKDINQKHPHIMFAKPGKYQFNIIHLMRTDSLKHILDFGIVLEKVNPNHLPK